MKSVIKIGISVLVLGFLYLGNAPAVFADQGFIVDQQLDAAKRDLDNTQRKITRLESQLKNMRQTVFATIEERARYAQEKADLAAQIKSLTAEAQPLVEIVKFLTNKRQLFPKKAASSSDFEIYSSPPLETKRYEEEAAKVQDAISGIFQTTSFTFFPKPQILIYPRASDCKAFEGSATPAAIQKLSTRICSYAFVGQSLGSKIPFLAISADESMDQFRHDIAHLFIEKLDDPLKPSPFAFMKEGLADNLVSMSNKEWYKSRGLSVAKNSRNGSSLTSFLTQAATVSPSESYLGEATLFVRWLSTLDGGMPLIRQLIGAKEGEHESVIKNYQWAKGMERTGFAQYEIWRSAELDRLEGKTIPTATAPACTSISPPPTSAPPGTGSAPESTAPSASPPDNKSPTP